MRWRFFLRSMRPLKAILECRWTGPNWFGFAARVACRRRLSAPRSRRACSGANRPGNEQVCRRFEMTLVRAAAAETIGTALLLAIVVGSGIMGERLAHGNAAVALLANSFATGAGLYTLILVLGPISGAHFNPVVSGVCLWNGRLSGYQCVVYV